MSLKNFISDYLKVVIKFLVGVADPTKNYQFKKIENIKSKYVTKI